MVKEACITQLGETLNHINKALDQKDLNELSPDRLLDYKLKYINQINKTKDNIVKIVIIVFSFFTFFKKAFFLDFSTFSSSDIV